MKTVLAIAAFLAACAANPSSNEPAPDPTMSSAGSAAPISGSPTPAASSAPVAGMTSRSPASAGRPACADLDSCSGAPAASLIAAAWVPAVDGARVEFPIALEASAAPPVIRGIMDCEPGAAASFEVKVNDPYNGWEATFGPITATCDSQIRGLDVPVDVDVFINSGYPGASTAPSMTAVFEAETAGNQGVHFRGVEIAQ